MVVILLLELRRFESHVAEREAALGEEGDGLQAVGEVHEVLALSKRREADLGSATMKDKPSGLTVDIVIAFIIIITTTTTYDM